MQKGKVIFVAHQVSGDEAKNLEKILSICKKIHSETIVPLFPSFTWRQYLGKSKKDIDKIKSVNELLFRKKAIDEVWLYGPKISNGMLDEIKLADKYGILVLAKSKNTLKELQKLRAL